MHKCQFVISLGCTTQLKWQTDFAVAPEIRPSCSWHILSDSPVCSEHSHSPIGAAVGDFVGAAVGAAVGATVGLAVGADMGDAVGAAVGALVGTSAGGKMSRRRSRHSDEVPFVDFPFAARTFLTSPTFSPPFSFVLPLAAALIAIMPNPAASNAAGAGAGAAVELGMDSPLPLSPSSPLP